jgi:hypothetical protein
MKRIRQIGWESTRRRWNDKENWRWGEALARILVDFKDYNGNCLLIQKTSEVLELTFISDFSLEKSCDITLRRYLRTLLLMTLMQEHIFQHGSENNISQPMYINLSPLFSLGTIIPYPDTFTLTPPSPLIPLLPIYHICPNYTKQPPNNHTSFPPHHTKQIPESIPKTKPTVGHPSNTRNAKKRETRQPDMMLLYFFLVLVAFLSHIHQNPHTPPLDKEATDWLPVIERKSRGYPAR